MEWLDFEDGKSKSLLRLCFNGWRIIPNLETLATLTGCSTGNIARILSCERGYAQRCADEFKQPILDFVRRSVNAISNDLPGASDEVLDVFLAHFMRPKDPLGDLVKDASTRIGALAAIHHRPLADPAQSPVTLEAAPGADTEPIEDDDPQERPPISESVADTMIEPLHESLASSLHDRDEAETNLPQDCPEDTADSYDELAEHKHLRRLRLKFIVQRALLWTGLVAFLTVSTLVMFYFHDAELERTLLTGSQVHSSKPTFLCYLLPGQTDFERAFNREVQSYVDRQVPTIDELPFTIEIGPPPEPINFQNDAQSILSRTGADGLAWFTYANDGHAYQIIYDGLDPSGNSESGTLNPLTFKSDTFALADRCGLAVIEFAVETMAKKLEARHEARRALITLESAENHVPGLGEASSIKEAEGRLDLETGDADDAVGLLLSAKGDILSHPTAEKNDLWDVLDAINRETAESLVEGGHFEDAYAVYAPLMNRNGDQTSVSIGDHYLVSNSGLALVAFQFPPRVDVLVQPDKNSLIVSESPGSDDAELYNKIAPEAHVNVTSGSAFDNLLVLAHIHPGKGVYWVDWKNALRAKILKSVPARKLRDWKPPSIVK